MNILSKIIKGLSSLLPSNLEKQRQEKYLNEATSIIDLEMRMREIDRRHSY